MAVRKGSKCSIERSDETKKIVLPDKMDLKDAIVWLERKDREENKEFHFREVIDAFPFDGAHALMLALEEIYGWAEMVKTPGFFGDSPPMMVGVEVAPGETKQVPWGRMKIPGIPGHFYTGLAEKDGRFIFVIEGETIQKHKKDVSQLAERTREIVKERSIYKGKAIRVDMDAISSSNDFSPEKAPRFIDVSKVDESQLILSEQTEQIVNTSLFTPLERTEECQKYGVPLKRGILLEGRYGTGKTLTAHVCAKKATANGWTFIYLKKVDDLETAVEFAKQYQPAVIFAEDIDRVTSDRNDAMNGILNTIDGIDTKNSNVIVCLTTNHVEKIHKSMLRPGRLDSVISVDPPDAGAVIRLIRLYAGGMVPDNADLSKVGKKLAGNIPAVVREVVERSKLGAISRGELENSPLVVTADDLLIAAESMLRHLELLMEQKDQKDPLPGALQEVGKQLFDGQLDDLRQRLIVVEKGVDDVYEQVI